MSPPQQSVPDAELARLRVMVLLLLLAVLAVYFPLHNHDFIMFDDEEYIFNNPAVPQGLTWDGVVWAFTHHHASNWHPLTWISHMLDVQLFGFKAGAHHLVNVLFHVANTFLLFRVLLRMTANPWPSLLVAGWFGLHPLHVESVAWASERKDVLSAFFWLLAMLAYVRYVEKPDARRYLLTLACFAAGLLAKPMVVTFPCALLLLDVWPLKRFSGKWWPLVREKIPFFALSAVVCLITIYTQKQKAMSTLDDYSLPVRFSNAAVAYVSYLGKTIWPLNLAIFYPHAKEVFWPATILSGLVLAAITSTVVKLARPKPWLAIGWCWYLGTLVPVIGILQVGDQSMADRYTYLPLVGIFIMVAWAGFDLAARYPRAVPVAGAGAVVSLVLCGAVSHRQAGCWENTFTVFEHAIQVTGPNALAHENLGWAYLQMGRFEQSADHYRRLVELVTDPDTLNLYGEALLRGGHPEAALAQFKRAIEIDPENPVWYNNQAQAFLAQGFPDAALASVNQGLAIEPEAMPNLHTTRAQILERLGKADVAMTAYDKAYKIDPTFVPAQLGLGFALLKQGRVAAAVELFTAAVRSNWRNNEVQYGLGMALLAQGKTGDAAQQFLVVLERNPHHVKARDQLARLLVRLGHAGEAVKLYEEGLQDDSSSGPLLEGLAWLQATAPDERVRNGGEAVKLAERAASLPTGGTPTTLDVLAAAYAEAGRFDDALQAGQRALDARPAPEDLPAVQARLKLYQAHQPYRQK